MLHSQIEEEGLFTTLENLGQDWEVTSKQISDRATREREHNEEQDFKLEDYESRYFEKEKIRKKEFEMREFLRRGEFLKASMEMDRIYDLVKADIETENQVRRLTGQPLIPIPKRPDFQFIKKQYRQTKYRPPKKKPYFNEGDLLMDVLRSSSVTGRSFRKMKLERRAQSKLIDKINAGKKIVEDQVWSDIREMQNSNKAGKKALGYGAELFLDIFF